MPQTIVKETQKQTRTCMEGCLIYNKGNTAEQWGESLLNKWFWMIGQSHWKTERDLIPPSYHTQKFIVDLNMKVKI